MAMIDISITSGTPLIGALNRNRENTSALIATMMTKIHAVPIVLRAVTSPSNAAMTAARQPATDTVSASVV